MEGAGYRKHRRPVQVGVRVTGSSGGEVARESADQMRKSKRGKTEKELYAKYREALGRRHIKEIPNILI